jgi:hypothetical protein
LKRGLIAGAAVLVLGGAAVGVTAAQAQPAPTATPSANPRQKFEEALANRLHVTVDQLRQAIQGARQDAGLPAPGANGRGPRGFAPPRGAFAFFGAEAQAVADLFKESTADLRAELPGNTLEDLAKKHGVSTTDLVTTIVQTADQHIDQIAKDRNLSADRASQLKQQISERAQQFVTTHRFPARGSGIRS